MPGAKKGQNNFKRYQANKVARRKAALAAALEDKALRKIRWANFSAFVDHMAGKTGIPATTLIRSGSAYREMLWQKWAEQNVDLRLVDVDSATADQLRDMVRLRNLELSNRNADIERYKRVLERVEADRAPALAADSAPALPGPQEPEPSGRFQADFEATCQALRGLLEHLSEAQLGVSLNKKSGSIIDEEAGAYTTVVDGKILRPFLRWLDGQE